MRFAHTRHGCCLCPRRLTPHWNFQINLSLAINFEFSEKMLFWDNDFMPDYAFRNVSWMGILFCQSKVWVQCYKTGIHVIYHATAHGCSWLRWNMDHNHGVIPQGILCPLYANTWIFQKNLILHRLNKNFCIDRNFDWQQISLQFEHPYEYRWTFFEISHLWISLQIRIIVIFYSISPQFKKKNLYISLRYL